MLGDTMLNAIFEAVELIIAGGLLYFLYSLWRDARNLFLR